MQLNASSHWVRAAAPLDSAAQANVESRASAIAAEYFMSPEPPPGATRCGCADLNAVELSASMHTVKWRRLLDATGSTSGQPPSFNGRKASLPGTVAMIFARSHSPFDSSGVLA